ncbi:AMP-binding protein [Pseudonocardia lacus]|uniref:AMP-binding protein n=1 Tax=Pseudonocardia lacus TaxID=2835865 RepID=UPI001BDD8535|nr:AMP-binding protein [Pseudonocardia lacus]
MGDEPAVRCGPVERTYPQLHGRAARLAAALDALGVGPGDRVAIVLRNDVAYLEAMIAVGLLGAVPVPVNWHWRARELAHLLADCAARAVLAHTHLVEEVEAALPDGATIVEVAVPDGLAAAYGLPAAPPLTGRHPDLEGLVGAHEPWTRAPDTAPMAMIYSSGTTGTPKGILRDPLRPEDGPVIAQVVFQTFGIRPGHRVLLPAPLYHTAPNTHAAIAAATGLDITIMPRFDAEEALALVERHRINSTQVVPTMFVRMLNLPEQARRRYDLSSLEAVVHAAAPCPPAVKRRMIDWLGPIVLEYYGGTETGMVTWCDSAQWLAHPGTVGRAIDGADVRIVDPDGGLLPPGESGRVFLKPPPFWPAFTYHGDPAKRAAIELDGYVTVGDVGYLDDDGFLHLNDRSTDMVISGGVNIYPAEIEHALLEVPGVRDAAVFGVPDPEYGETLVAHVDTDPDTGPSAERIGELLRASIAGYKVPRRIVIDRELPREDTGKLFKRKLRERYLAPTAG